MHDEDYVTPEGFRLPRRLLLPDVRSFTDLYDVVRPWDFTTMNHVNGVRPRPDLVPDAVKIGNTGAEIGPFCAVRNLKRPHFAVIAKPIVVEAVKPLIFSNTVLGTEVIFHERTGRALVVVSHQSIIASHWLAYIDPDTIPTGVETNA